MYLNRMAVNLGWPSPLMCGAGHLELSVGSAAKSALPAETIAPDTRNRIPSSFEFTFDDSREKLNDLRLLTVIMIHTT